MLTIMLAIVVITIRGTSMMKQQITMIVMMLMRRLIILGSLYGVGVGDRELLRQRIEAMTPESKWERTRRWNRNPRPQPQKFSNLVF